jgi:hypothetical protein
LRLCFRRRLSRLLLNQMSRPNLDLQRCRSRRLSMLLMRILSRFPALLCKRQPSHQIHHRRPSQSALFLLRTLKSKFDIRLLRHHRLPQRLQNMSRSNRRHRRLL